MFQGVSAGPSTRPPPWRRARSARASSSPITAAIDRVTVVPGTTSPSAGRSRMSWNRQRRRWTSSGTPAGPGTLNRSMKSSPRVYQSRATSMSRTANDTNAGIP